MPDSRGPHQDPRHNPAWRVAQEWQQRARQSNGGGLLGSLKMLAAWLLFGSLMIIAMLFGLLFLLVGWAMLPFLRHRMKKQMEKMRADQAQDVGGGYHAHQTHYRETRHEERYGTGNRAREQQVLEGDYEVKDASRDRRDDA
ncbi:hypothetical protein [Halomonas cerina]|uniref:Putative lipid-binding transport protein (Tim44 family) n=1 Tax=Halomonas cerina TaxID=447424 RepID=A0A839VJ27_9GAMM|nr:hypothetical protein [Halomonas cerina]MBB3192386.1 putative lipid-binding transport protein (Tim44 family) [Halomonas cerina]